PGEIQGPFLLRPFQTRRLPWHRVAIDVVPRDELVDAIEPLLIPKRLIEAADEFPVVFDRHGSLPLCFAVPLARDPKQLAPIARGPGQPWLEVGQDAGALPARRSGSAARSRQAFRGVPTRLARGRPVSVDGGSIGGLIDWQTGAFLGSLDVTPGSHPISKWQ